MFPLRFRKADTTWNAKQRNDSVQSDFRSNSVCLNTQYSLLRVSEDGLTRKSTMHTFFCFLFVLFCIFLFGINIFHFFNWNATLFEIRFPNYNSSKLYPQAWLIVTYSLCLLKFYKEKVARKFKGVTCCLGKPDFCTMQTANDPWYQRFCPYCAFVPRFQTDVTYFCSFEFWPTEISFLDHSLGFLCNRLVNKARMASWEGCLDEALTQQDVTQVQWNQVWRNWWKWERQTRSLTIVYTVCFNGKEESFWLQISFIRWS